MNQLAHLFGSDARPISGNAVLIGRPGLLLVFLVWASIVATSCALRPPNASTSPTASPIRRPGTDPVASRALSTSVLGPTPVTLAPSTTPAQPLAKPSTDPSATQSAAGRILSAPAPTAVPSVAPASGPAIQVYLDPGHGGVDAGTSGTTATGETVREKDVALALALRTAAHLRAAGIGVALSRSDDSLPGAIASDYTRDGTLLTPPGVLADLQRRIDRANASGARVFLSIHLNAYDDPSVGGTQTFYDGARPFANQSLSLATVIQASVITALRSQGYTTPDRGVTDDQDLQAVSLDAVTGNYNHLILLGPAIPGVLRPTTMPGALCEVMYLSNPPEAMAIAQSVTQDLIAKAVADAIEQFLRTNTPVPPAGQ
jgi:N-acetylmuramoyl-L-alanine amidase